MTTIEMEEEGRLVADVIEEMQNVIEHGDWDAIDELLRFVPRERLIGFLPDVKQELHKQ
jgi:hypothetical protein